MKTTSSHSTLVASLIIIITGCLVQAGWIFQVPFLKSFLPGATSMKFNTAICFVLSGIALFLLNQPVLNRTKRWVVRFCAGIVLLVATITFLQYLLDRNLGIDQLVWKEGSGSLDTDYPGRMSQSTAINFMLTGFIFFNLHKKQFHWLIQALLFLMISGSILIVFNHLFDGSFLASLPQLSKTPMPTAIVFLLLCTGIFLSAPMRYIRFSFQKKIVSVFALTVLLLGIIFYAYKKNSERTADTAQRVALTNKVISQSTMIHTTLAEMQNSVRGFLITGDMENYLPDFNQSSVEIISRIQELKALTKDNAEQISRINNLESLINEYIYSRKAVIQVRMGDGFASKKVKTATEEGKIILDRARSELTDIQQSENNLLARRKAENEQSILNSSRIITILQLMAGLLILAAFAVIYYNMRARNEAEKEIIAAQKRFATVFNVSPVAISISTIEEGILLYVNNALCELVKMKPEDIIGKKSTELQLVDAPQRQKILEHVAAGNARGIELTIKNGNGERVDILYSMEKVEVDGMRCLVTYVIDISDRKKAEKQVKELNENLEKRVQEKANEIIEKEKQYRFLLENMREGIQVIDPEWKYVFVNESVTYQGKYSKDQLLGRTMMEMYPGIEKTKLFSVLQECMRERKSRIMENEFSYPDGSKGCFELSIQPVPEGLFILSMDISEKKKAEQQIINMNNALEKRAAELQASNTELERFAYVASHDLQEPLRMVSSFMQLLEKRLNGGLDETSKKYLDFAVDGSERMKTLIQDLLQYSRVGTNKEDITEVDCNEVMSQVVKMYTLAIRDKNAVVNIHAMPKVRGIKTQVQQVFQNLLGNALKYNQNGSCKIEMGCEEVNNHWEFYVKDNGIGIDPRYFDKVFVLFQRLHNKNEYSGTGMGLAICKKIVERHGGQIWVKSAPGKGSTFYFTLPKTE